jgi:hypothetical protein
VDEIRLTLPQEPEYLPVAHLVLGGLGSRLDLTLEGLDDLKLALDSLVERARARGEVTIAVRLEDRVLRTEVGPFDADALRAELAEPSAGVGLRRILDTVVDRVDVHSGDGGDWVTLAKAIPSDER